MVAAMSRHIDDIQNLGVGIPDIDGGVEKNQRFAAVKVASLALLALFLSLGVVSFVSTTRRLLMPGGQVDGTDVQRSIVGSPRLTSAGANDGQPVAGGDYRHL